MRTRIKNGFTLVEMAIVLAIVALILGTGLTLLSAQQEQQRIQDTRALLSDAREMLIGYALIHIAADAHPYLPCPDVFPGVAVSAGNVANDGKEDRNAATGNCDQAEGDLPWVTLGMTPQIDPWSDRLRYRVTAAFASSVTGMLLTSNGDIDVLDAVSGNVLASNVPAVIVAHGKNGLGAINATGNANPAPPAASTNETENANNDRVFISHTQAQAGETGGEFDDQIIWLSPYILFNRMVQAGKLP